MTTPIREATELLIEQNAPLAHYLKEPCICPKGGIVDEDNMIACGICGGSEYKWKEGALEAIETLLTKHTERAIKIHDLENHIERLDVQCDEKTGCKNCDSKRPLLKKLQAELSTLKTQLEAKDE